MKININDIENINTTLRTTGTQEPLDVIKAVMGDVDVTSNLQYRTDKQNFIIAKAPKEFKGKSVDFTLQNKPYFLKKEDESEIEYLTRLNTGYNELEVDTPKIVLNKGEVRISASVPGLNRALFTIGNRPSFKVSKLDPVYQVFKVLFIEKATTFRKGQKEVSMNTGEQESMVFVFFSKTGDVEDLPRLKIKNANELGTISFDLGSVMADVILLDRGNLEMEVLND